MRSQLSSLVIVVVFLVATWVVASLLGFRFNLLGSVVLSVILTVVLNLVLRAFRRG